MAVRIKLIVIHEDPLKFAGILQVLKSRGYSMAAALSGAEGMKLVKKTKPDLILLDATLPDVSGIELCGQIKSDPALSQCLVILLDSAMTLTDMQAPESDLCADSYIAGPVSHLELSIQIQAMLRIKSTRDALKASEERYRLMYEKIPVPFLTMDKNGGILSVNPATERLLGYRKTEAAGTPFYDLLPSSDAETLRTFLSSTNSPERRQGLQLNVRRKDGSLLRVLLTGFKVTGNGSHAPSLLCILFEGPQKSTHTESASKAQQLEFTATLAGGIAHDFNNLLMSIMGNISLAQLYLNPEDKAVKILEKAESTCNQGKELTEQFIILSKCGYPSKKPSSILKLLKESSVIGIPNPQVDVVLDLPDDIWKIEVDEHQMRYALSHLITNAVEAMPGGGKVFVRIKNTVVSSNPPFPPHPISSGSYLHITIQDQGRGIASEHLPRIFDPYYTTKELGPQKGMGLGLTTVYSIIHKHDGYIFIESQVNQGTTVDIYLPAIPDNGNRQ